MTMFKGTLDDLFIYTLYTYSTAPTIGNMRRDFTKRKNKKGIRE